MFSSTGALLPVVDSLQNGKYTLVWEDASRDGDGSGVFGNVVSVNGTKDYSDDFILSNSAAGMQSWPTVTGFTSGSSDQQFLGIWKEDNG